MIIKEIRSKAILSKSQVHDYTINPYVGCQHACSYCYARFMKRFTGHREPWGQFVDVKINAAELLEAEVHRKKRGSVWVSGVCDPYQPLEGRYKITRQCLQILAANDWPVVIQTRSPLVLRDLDILKTTRHFEAGFSIGTADDAIRRLFEPGAPPITARINALAELHGAGVSTYAMIAPILPGAEGLMDLLAGKVDHILTDRMNYHNADWVYQKYGLGDKLSDSFFDSVEERIEADCRRLGIEHR
jgi:DNA repair photolyase